MKQSIRYLTAGDGTRLAWSSMGTGMPLVKAANWLSHLEYDLESPIWQHWMRFLGGNFHFIRYDERGCGMTGGDPRGLSLSNWLSDLEAVVDAAQIERPFALLGISQGAAACLAYAVKHPRRVSHLLLYGGYARGAYERGNAEAARMYHAIVDIARGGWDDHNPVFRQLFTARFIPGATDAQVQWFNELARTTTTAESAGALLEARAHVNVTALLPQVSVPTLVMHGREDGVVPLEEGRLLAAGITGARFVELESRNHVLLDTEPAWPRFCEEMLQFLGRDAPDALAGLTGREREIVEGLVAGRTNAEIAASLFISDKTVRNSLTRIFDKLGVRSRTQAMALLRGGTQRG
ncbi:alpha/beta fold hydrolase [Lysobacter sp. FW306-1B-D06B]|uniref:alpha/beta fold hydrolase n=1 Tax=Lysobacter sp. FW306-1B-D06B TaxID=3140250 RepID=UPI00314056C7